jgi:hypothetical protein
LNFQVHYLLGRFCLDWHVTFDTNRMIGVLCVAVVLVGAVMFAYRQHLDWDAHWITKILCEGLPVFSGGYKRCLDHYAPAGLTFTPV